MSELYKHKLLTADGTDIALGPALSSGQIQPFVASVWADISNDSLNQAGAPVSVLVGATGGVRSLVDSGEVSDADLQAFSSHLRSVCGDGASFCVLSGEDEAGSELVAARLLFHQVMQAEGVNNFGLVSGGGMSCQFAWVDADGADQIKCVRLNTFAANEILTTKGLEDGSPEVEANFAAVMAEAALPGPLSGVFVASAVQHTVAVVGGWAERFVTAHEIRPNLDVVISQLKAGEGAAWDATKEKYGDNISSMGTVVYVCALRLRIILSQFTDDAKFFFARQAPGSSVNVEWSVGKFLAAE